MRKSCITSPPLADYFSKLPQDSLHIWKNYLGDLNSHNMFSSKSPNTVQLEGYFFSVSCHRGSNLWEMFRKKNPKTKKWGFLFIRHAEMFWTFFPKITTSGLHLFVKFHGFSPLRVYLNHDDMNIVFQNDLNVLLLCVNNNVAERQ